MTRKTIDKLLFYDAGCQVCRESKHLGGGLLRRLGVAALPLQGRVAQRLLPAIERDDPAGVQLRGRQLRAEGSEALRLILRDTPCTRPLAALLDRPPLSRAWRKTYRLIARHRHRFGRRDCLLPARPTTKGRTP